MAEMILNRLSVSNFKGIKSLELRFAQDRTDIFGRNASGKTTIVDAFCWVLWNKDSNDNAPGTDAFHEKPLDNQGREIHYLDTEVELDCTLDGKPFVLKRTQREHWEKKRGFVDETYKGNESTYWINGIETKSSEFKSRIAEIVPADIFKYVGKLGAFNNLKWQDRRSALVALSDTDIDNALLKSSAYSSLAKALDGSGCSVDEFRKLLTDRRKMINDTLKVLPVRIDEAKKGIVEMTDTQVADLKYIVKEANEDIATVNSQIDCLLNGGNHAADKLKLSILEGQAAMIKRGMQADLIREAEAARAKVNEERAILERLQAYVGDCRAKAKAISAETENAEAERKRLLDEFAKAKAISTNVVDRCPTCGRELEPEQIEQAVAEATANRKALMDEIRTRGKAAALRLDDCKLRAAEAGQIIIDAGDKVKAQEMKLAEALAALGNVRKVPDYEANAELQAVLKEIDTLHTDDAMDTDVKLDSLRSRIKEIEETRDRAADKLAAYRAAESMKTRVAELEAQRKTEGVNLAETEKMLDLAEQFVRERCSSLEDSINRHFDNVRWKLFNTQINGGLADCCVCMIPCGAGLVPYECANTASQINADIEIIRNLSGHYGVKLPLFVDNAERINTMANAGTQMITLSVSTDEELKVED